jgi:hypothetical protein
MISGSQGAAPGGIEIQHHARLFECSNLPYERQITEFIEDVGVLAGQIVGNAAGTASSSFRFELC